MLPPGPFDCIVADPPWRFSSNSVTRPGRNPMRHYPTMTLKEIAAAPVQGLLADDAILWLWITGPLLAIGAHLPIMRSWGFKPSGFGLVWVKLNRRATSLFFLGSDIAIGTGFTTRKNVEVCLIGKRGRSLRRDAGVPEVIVAPKREHSRKPEESRDRIRRYVGADALVLELFAREGREADRNWQVWGNQTDRFTAAALPLLASQAAFHDGAAASATAAPLAAVEAGREAPAGERASG